MNTLKMLIVTVIVIICGIIGAIYQTIEGETIMSTITRTITYRCSDDCVPSGCPSHEGQLIYQSCSDSYTFIMNGRESHYERGELDAMIALLKSLDRRDSVEV